MPHVSAYLFFDGACADAMRFYERTLGGKLSLMTAGEIPDGSQVPGNANRIVHARLDLLQGALLASDWLAGNPYEAMKGFRVSLTYSTATEARRVFEALAQGGQVTMPMEKTFWSEAFGMLTDRFGTPWMVNTESPRA
jgi:PhnB protein